MEKLTAQEETAMRLIWEIGPCVVRMLQEKYPEPKPPYTTLASVVTERLCKEPPLWKCL
jgi:BlaI family penicillinase repressor